MSGEFSMTKNYLVIACFIDSHMHTSHTRVNKPFYSVKIQRTVSTGILCCCCCHLAPPQGAVALLTSLNSGRGRHRWGKQPAQQIHWSRSQSRRWNPDLSAACQPHLGSLMPAQTNKQHKFLDTVTSHMFWSDIFSRLSSLRFIFGAEIVSAKTSQSLNWSKMQVHLKRNHLKMGSCKIQILQNLFYCLNFYLS